MATKRKSGGPKEKIFTDEEWNEIMKKPDDKAPTEGSTPEVDEEKDEEELKTIKMVEYHKMYSKVTVRLKAYLPKVWSALGGSKRLLSGIIEGTFKYPLGCDVGGFCIQYAPSDDVLLELLGTAQMNSVRYPDFGDQNFGYYLGLMPDTQYMINMIMFFDPYHTLGTGIIKDVGYYPVLFGNEARKFEANEVPFYD